MPRSSPPRASSSRRSSPPRATSRLRSCGPRVSAQAAILNAEGESRAILQVFDAIHRGDADPKLLAYQYLQTLPQIASGTVQQGVGHPHRAHRRAWAASPRASAAHIGRRQRQRPGAVRAARPAPRRCGRRTCRRPLLPDPAEALAQALRDSEAATADAVSAGTLSGNPADRRAEAGQRPYTGRPPPAPTDEPDRFPTQTRPTPGMPPAIPTEHPGAALDDTVLDDPRRARPTAGHRRAGPTPTGDRHVAPLRDGPPTVG